MTAYRLTDQVWLIGGADTSPYDCNVFLVDGGGEAAVIDCGTGLASEALLANLAETGIAERVTRILVTHYHGDHAGGAAALRAATGANLCASAETAEALAIGCEQRTQVAAAREAGVYPPEFRLQAAEVDTVLEHERYWRLGDLELTVYTTPGHCDGHLCFLVTGETASLFTGDAIFAGGRVSVQPIPDCRPDRYAETARLLASLPCDDLFPGHLEQAIGDGAEHLRAAADTFNRLVVPPNILS